MRNSLHTTQPIGMANFKSYAIGFILSLALTLVAYFIVMEQLLSGWLLDTAVASLGLVQAWVLLFFFINMRKEPKPRWNLIVFLFMVMVCIIVVFGSLWIMYHLNYNLMGHA